MTRTTMRFPSRRAVLYGPAWIRTRDQRIIESVRHEYPQPFPLLLPFAESERGFCPSGDSNKHDDQLHGSKNRFVARLKATGLSASGWACRLEDGGDSASLARQLSHLPGRGLRGGDRRSLVPERLIEIRLVDSPCSQHLLRRKVL
jgi:hypothetical protein